MYVFAFILGVWLLPKAHPLQCNVCDSFGDQKNCKNTTPCNECGTVRITSDVPSDEMLVKRCYTFPSCVEGSLTIGSGKIQSTCCKKDLCNSDVPAAMAPNNAKCFVCDGNNCTKVVNCEGDEDNCFTATGYIGVFQTTVKGCASKNLCFMENIPFVKQFPVIDIDCCTGNLCNKASSGTRELWFLLVPLICSVLF